MSRKTLHNKKLQISDYMTSKFRKNLEICMEKKKMSQIELAKALKTSPQNVCRWLSGRVLPRKEMLYRIADLFDTEAKDLLGASSEVRYDGRLVIPVFRRVGKDGSLKNRNRDRDIEVTLDIKNRFGDQLFGLLINDESMMNAGMIPGDIVIISKHKKVSNTCIALVSVQGKKPILYRYFLQGSFIVLIKEDRESKPVIIEKGNSDRDLNIIGVVVRLLREF